MALRLSFSKPPRPTPSQQAWVLDYFPRIEHLHLSKPNSTVFLILIFESPKAVYFSAFRITSHPAWFHLPLGYLGFSNLFTFFWDLSVFVQEIWMLQNELPVVNRSILSEVRVGGHSKPSQRQEDHLASFPPPPGLTPRHLFGGPTHMVPPFRSFHSLQQTDPHTSFLGSYSALCGQQRCTIPSEPHTRPVILNLVYEIALANSTHR